MKRQALLRPALPLLLAGLLCAPAAFAGQADKIQVHGAWIRVLPGALPAGGFVTLQNTGDHAAVLRGATSDRYASVMLHHSSTAGGMSRMTMVDHLDIPAHGQVALSPGGYHLMLSGARSPVTPGQTVRLTLQFADGSALPADFLARPANALGATDAH